MPLPGLEPARRLHVRQLDPGRIRERHRVQRAVHGDVLNVELPRRKARHRLARLVSILLTDAPSHGGPWFGFFAS